MKYPKGSKLWYEREASEDEFLRWYHEQDQPNYEKPSVTVDLIGLRFNTDINQLQILLVQRIANPDRGKWALPGGFIEPNETTYDAVQREVEEETSLKIDKQRIQLLPLVSTPNRDPRMWVMTNPNIVLFTPYDNFRIKAGDDAQKVDFFSIKMNSDNTLQIHGLANKQIAFDHYDLIKSALLKLRVEVDRHRYDNIFPLLSKQFTSSQVLTLFKAIDPKRFENYTPTGITRNLKNYIIKVGTAKATRVGKPNLLFELKEKMK